MTKKVAARYAKALFNSASKDDRHNLLNNFKDLLSLYDKVPKLSSFLNSPEISAQHKETVLQKAFKEKPNFMGFLSLILQKNRFKYIKEIAEEYHNVFTNAYGISPAHLTTAIPLDDQMKNHLEEKLNRIYDKKFEIIYDTDPNIIGGGVLIIDNRMIDFRIKNRLNKLRSYLQKSSNN